MTSRTATSRSQLARLGFADLSGTLERIAALEARPASDLRVPIADAESVWAATADPDGALLALERLIESAPEQLRPVLADAGATERLVRLLGASIGLAEFLQRRPDELALLLEPVAPPWSQERYTASLDEAVDGSSGRPPAVDCASATADTWRRSPCSTSCTRPRPRRSRTSLRASPTWPVPRSTPP